MFQLKSKRSNRVNAITGFIFFRKITKNWKKTRILALIRVGHIRKFLIKKSDSHGKVTYKM